MMEISQRQSDEIISRIQVKWKFKKMGYKITNGQNVDQQNESNV